MFGIGALTGRFVVFRRASIRRSKIGRSGPSRRETTEIIRMIIGIVIMIVVFNDFMISIVINIIVNVNSIVLALWLVALKFASNTTS